MHIRILGSAAGGGFPQWNCGCGNCVAVRRKTQAIPTFKPRTQAQIAVSSDSTSWFLVGASPDLRQQIESTEALHPRASRDSPISGVVLGSADLDHVLGLLLLRELQPLRVYAAPSILKILREENSMFGMLNRVEPQVIWTPMHPGAPFPLLAADGKDSGLRCQAVYLSGRYPQYVKTEAAKLGAMEAGAALFFESSSGKRLAYLPAVGSLTDALLEHIQACDLLLFDGTFWSADELIRIQGGGETAHQMGHIPVEESLRLLKNISIDTNDSVSNRVKRKIFIHLNNTNPMLNEASDQHQAVRAAGWEVAEDNWQLEL
jgi:pyrroloquinoline quinone biosynthesis protein B